MNLLNMVFLSPEGKPSGTTDNYLTGFGMDIRHTVKYMTYFSLDFLVVRSFLQFKVTLGFGYLDVVDEAGGEPLFFGNGLLDLRVSSGLRLSDASVALDFRRPGHSERFQVALQQKNKKTKRNENKTEKWKTSHVVKVETSESLHRGRSKANK